MNEARIFKMALLAAACSCMAACSDAIVDMKLTPEVKARVLALQNPFGNQLVRIPGTGDGDTLVGMGPGCKTYRAVVEQGVVTEWLPVRELDHVNFLSGGTCRLDKFGLEGPYLRIQYCAQAIGAGGGCGGGAGDFRSQDGMHWETYTERRGWQAVGPSRSP